jgi:hypothetical protein
MLSPNYFGNADVRCRPSLENLPEGHASYRAPVRLSLEQVVDLFRPANQSRDHERQSMSGKKVP